MGKERKLTKAQLVDSIYLDVDVAKKDVHQVLDLFFEAVKDGLLEDRVIELRGFGTFELRTRRGRQARNPKTGEDGTRGRARGGRVPARPRTEAEGVGDPGLTPESVG